MAGGIVAQHPAMKLTVGAQYIVFDTQAADGTWSNTFDTTVYKLPTVTDVEVKDQNDSYESYASGDVYDSDTQTSYKEISETNLAFPEELLAKMNGDTVSDGVIIENGMNARPYFAYGMVVKKKDGTLDLRWYPKCKKTDNSDKTSTSEDKHKDQTDSVTIRAYGYDSDLNKTVRVLTSSATYKSLTEEKFFAKPLLTGADVKALVASGS